MRYTDRMTHAGITRRRWEVVGHAYDHAYAESVIGHFMTDVIRRRGPWRHLEAAEFATLTWVGQFNTRRLLARSGTCRRRSTKRSALL